jgi:NADPH:quinone reductase-like Zn-dependent oxidoreductase
MPYAVFPRTPGRDYAGVVIDGPAEWIGREVFGSSGDLGIRRDGTHATHLVVESDAVVEKPASISWEEAAGIGVPFVTAMEGLRRAGLPNRDETVLVMGVNGKVGQAAVQIATWRGARVIGVVRRNERYEGHANSNVDVIDASATDVATRVREITGGKGADIVFNTVGDPYFQAAHKSLAIRGRQILIAAVDRIVQFNILEFYRGQHTYVGIDTLGLSSIATGAVLRELGSGFAAGHLKPFPIRPGAIYPPEQAKVAFTAVAGSSRDRVILRPDITRPQSVSAPVSQRDAGSVEADAAQLSAYHSAGSRRTVIIASPPYHTPDSHRLPDRCARRRCAAEPRCWMASSGTGLLVSLKGHQCVGLDTECSQHPTATEVGQVDNEAGAIIAARAANQLDRRLRRATRGDQVVNDQDGSPVDGILVHLDDIDAVLQRVLLPDRLQGSLPSCGSARSRSPACRQWLLPG